MLARLEEIASAAWGAGFVDGLILLRHGLEDYVTPEVVEKLDSMVLRTVIERMRKYLGEGTVRRILEILEMDEERVGRGPRAPE